MLSMEHLLEAIYKNKVADADKAKNLEGELAGLRVDVGRLTAALSLLLNVEGEGNAPVGFGGKDYVS
jgi:hypothetical protein